MTPEELARLRELHETASPAPWYIEPVEEMLVHGTAEDGEEVGATYYHRGKSRREKANRKLLTEARNALPHLLEHIDKLTQRAERAEARLARINRAHPAVYEEALTPEKE